MFTTQNGSSSLWVLQESVTNHKPLAPLCYIFGTKENKRDLSFDQ